MGAGTSLPAIRKLLISGAALCAVTLAAAPKTAREGYSAKDEARAEITAASAAANLTQPTDAPPADLRMGDVDFQVVMQSFPDTYVGMTHFETHTVQIDPSSGAEMRKLVYLHELMHVAWHNGEPSANKNRKYTEEEAIRELTPGLLKMLAENPEAVKYLQK